MEPKLKRDIRIAGIGLAAAAVWLPAMVFAMMHLPGDFVRDYAPFVIVYGYVFLCLFNLVWGSVQVIWELPGKNRRLFLLLLWLILYPAVCVGWYFLCFFGFFLIYHVH